MMPSENWTTPSTVPPNPVPTSSTNNIYSQSLRGRVLLSLSLRIFRLVIMTMVTSGMIKIVYIPMLLMLLFSPYGPIMLVKIQKVGLWMLKGRPNVLAFITPFFSSILVTSSYCPTVSLLKFGGKECIWSFPTSLRMELLLTLYGHRFVRH